MNAAGKKCMGAEGDTVVLTGCDSGSTWETQGNGAFFAFAINCYIGLFEASFNWFVSRGAPEAATEWDTARRLGRDMMWQLCEFRRAHAGAS